MKLRNILITATTLILLGGGVVAQVKAGSNTITSKGIFSTDDGSIVFDSRDFDILASAIEEAKAESYEQGVQDGKASVTLKDIVNNYDSVSVQNVSYGIGTTTLSEGLYYMRGGCGNWTSNWGGRVADIYTDQYIVDPEGKLLARFASGTYEGDYFRGHSLPYQLVYCPEGSKLVITARVTHDNGASSNVSGTLVRFTN